MFGVVLWSNPDEGKAVIWCEDQGDLAYVKPGGLGPDPLMIEAGDLVELELSQGARSRSVESARLIERQAYPTLADKLLGTGSVESPSGDTAEIIQFNRLPKRAPSVGAARRAHPKDMAAS